MRFTSLLSILSLLAAAAGCPGPAASPTCAAGLVAEGDRCVPRLDTCPTRFEVPVLGGGCQPVGVTACATGMVSDGEGGCAPVLPDGPCAPGTMPLLGETACQPVGVMECGTGMVSDGEGGCSPILPPSPCGEGLIERLGSETCEVLQDCGGSPWGSGPLDATAVFVDASAVPGAGDGSADAPVSTVAEAVALAAPGSQVVIASGHYAEAVVVDRLLRVQGRCAAEVTLEGPDGPFDATGPLTLQPGASGTRLSGVTFTGGGRGIAVSGARDVILEAVVVRDTGGAGIHVSDGGSVTAHRVRVDRAVGHGLYSRGSDLRLEDAIVQATRPRDDGRYGRGITASCDEPAARCGTLIVERSILRGNRDLGIFTLGQDTEVIDSVVSGTLPTEDASDGGRGIDLECDVALASCPPARISGCVVSGNHEMGLYVGGVDAEIHSTVVEDTHPQLSDGHLGRGVDAECDVDLGQCGSVSIRRSVIRRNTEVGVFAWGVPVQLIGSIVADQIPRPVDGQGGRGFGLECNPRLDRCGAVRIEDSLITRNAEAAVFAAGVAIDVVRSAVIDSLPPTDGGPDVDLAGAGLLAICDPLVGQCARMRVQETLIKGNMAYGIAAGGAELSVVASAVIETRSDVTGGWGRGIHTQCHPTVGGCGRVLVDGSHLARNHEHGIAVAGSEVLIRRTTLRDTLPIEGSYGFGWGVHAQCDPGGACGSLRIEEGLVAGSACVGVFAVGMAVEIVRTAVVDTLPDVGELREGMDGEGIWVQPDLERERDASLLLVDSLVDGAYTAGVFVAEASARVEGCLIRDVAEQLADGRFGVAIGLGTPTSRPGLWLEVDRSVLLDAELAGIYLVDADGQIHRSRLAGADFPVVFTEPLRTLEIGDDNDLSGEVSSEPVRSSQGAVPSPPPSLQGQVGR